MTYLQRTAAALSITALTATTALGCAVDVADPDEPIDSAEAAVSVTGPAFYAHGSLYRTVGTPALLPDAAPSDSFDVIYDVSAYQPYNVANAAPKSRDYNGGRWEVHPVSFADYAAALAAHDDNMSGDFDSASEIEAAIAAGDATDEGLAIRFECPVIPLPRN